MTVSCFSTMFLSSPSQIGVSTTYKLLGDYTLGAPGNTMDIVSIPQANFLKVYISYETITNYSPGLIRFDNGDEHRYDYRYSVDGAAEVSDTNAIALIPGDSAPNSAFIEMDIDNTQTMPKITGTVCREPNSRSIFSCVYDSAGAITRVGIDRTGMLTGRMVVLGY